jgi:hypothetical protein
VAKHPFWCQLWIDGDWLDVTEDVRQTHPVRLVKGGGEVSAAPRPSVLSLTFNDQTGKYRPDRAMSPLYGKIGRNTPISVPGGIFEVSAWRPDRTVDHDGNGRGDQTCEVEAGGLLRRIGSWEAPVVSPLDETIRTYFAADLLGHWRLDDKAGSRYPARQAGLPDDSVFSFNTTFGVPDGPPGANTVAKLEASSALSGVSSPAVPGSPWRIGFAFRLDKQPTTVNPDNRLFFSDTTNGSVIDLWISATQYDLQISFQGGGTITHITGSHNRPPVFWTFVQIIATPSGGSTNIELDWYSLGGDTIYFGTTTVAYLVAEPRRWQISSNDATEGGLFSQVITVSGTGDLLNSEMVAAFNGRPGERAGDRFIRLMEAAGLDWEIEGDAADTVKMGPQTPGALLEQLKIIRDTEDGILYDSPFPISVTLRTRASLYAQDPVLELDGAAGPIGPPFVPVLDDLKTQNVITVSQVIGGEYTARDDTGPMGTLPSPDGVGEYKQEIDVVMARDADLQGRAEWALAQGTNPEARYSSLVIDLDADPSLESECDALKPGDRVVVTNIDPDPIDLLIVGITDAYDTQFRRRVTLTCRPYSPWSVGVYDDGERRYDSRSTTVEALTTSETIWDLTIQGRTDGWSTTATPYDVIVGGEVCTCTSMGAMTGTGPFAQQGTFTRSVNGVVKSHDLGTPVHIYRPARWAL